MNKKIYQSLILSLAVSSLSTLMADDTEVFYSVNVSKPNLLFVLDNSGSMNFDLTGNRPDSQNFTPPSRLTVLQNAVKAVLADAPDNVNVGLMRFGPGNNGNEWNTTNENWRTHNVNGVTFPLTDINALARDVIPTTNDVYGLPYYPGANETVRTYISGVVDNWTAAGGTPLVGALYEAALYFRGEQMRYGYDAPDGATGVGSHPSTYSGAKITNDISQTARNYSNAPSYISPITSSCQSNYIVLMSDGQPTYYYNGNANTQNVAWGNSRGPFAQFLQGRSGSSDLAAEVPNCVDSPSGFTAGKCGPELTRYIADHDNSSAMDGVQNIKTYTIGFGANLTAAEQSYLRSLETIDDDPDTGVIEDGYFTATNPIALAKAFKDILKDVAKPKGTMASPGYSVNIKSGLEHEKSIYIPVFDRKNTSRWSGNLKKFKLADVNGKRVIQGKNDLDAMDELGGFTNDAWDVWSDSATPDGKDILKGGVADKLTQPDMRKLYSNLTNNHDLTVTGNLLIESNVNSSITNHVLGILPESSRNDRKRIINYIRGWKNGEYDSNQTPKGIARKKIGDMLHSEPYVFTYPSGEQYIFAATNEGFLHAFDTTTGLEKFAFMPKELLKNIEPQLRNEGTAEDHLYGIDGSINLWDKRDSDGKPENVYLYFGLRRGGRSYYALDVTNINHPRFLWKVSASDSEFSSLGQSWSIPYLGKVGLGSEATPKEVVIFSGGYDPVEDRDIEGEYGKLDSSSKTVSTTMGNDIFIVDAVTGEKLWSLQDEFGDSIITDSIPGGVRYLDTNYNGIVDRMYFADTGGNIWRLDLSETIGSGNHESKLIKLASLGGADNNARKFYNEPDVAYMKLRGKSVFLVSIGSGFRAHPLDKEIDDMFFMLLDKSPYKPIDPENYETITVSDLAHIQISDSGTGATLDLTGSIKDVDKRGWKVSFPDNGEKVLSTALAFNGVMTFTTLVPEALLTGVGIDQCAAPAVQGRFYGINVLTGKAGLYLNQVAGGSGDPHGEGDGTQEIPPINIRSKPISKEPPGKPQVVFNGLDLSGGGCKHPVDIRVGKKLSQVTGYDTCRLESVYWSDPVKK